MKVTVIPLVIGVLGTVIKRIGKWTGGLGNKRTSGDHLNSNIKIGQNTENIHRDFKWLALIRTPVEDHQVTLA